MEDLGEFQNECCLCLKTFTDPKILPCLHTFCLKCLENTGEMKPEESMPCPACGSDFTVPVKGLSDLPRHLLAERETYNFTKSLINEELKKPVCNVCTQVQENDEPLAEMYCIACEDKMCRPCGEYHGKQKQHLVVALEAKDQSNNRKEAEEPRCQTHQEEIAELYCTYCKKVICTVCLNESHTSHNCSRVTEAANSIGELIEKESEQVLKMKAQFHEKFEKLQREKIKFLEMVKKMETEILKRCEEIKELVDSETRALLQELFMLKRERVEEIEIEHRRMAKHVFTLEKFKEYCNQIQTNAVSSYTCEAEGILRSTAEELRTQQQSRIKSHVLPFQVSIQKTDTDKFLISLNNAIGKINVICPFSKKLSCVVDTSFKEFYRPAYPYSELYGMAYPESYGMAYPKEYGRAYPVSQLYGMAYLHDKLYVLSNSILVYRARTPFARVGEIKTTGIVSPADIVSCPKTSCLYIYDKGTACIWKVTIPDHQVRCWLYKVKVPCAMTTSSSGEVLMVRNNVEPEASVTVEVYNQCGILTRELHLPKIITSLQRVYETQPELYIGLGEGKVYKFRANGFIIDEFEMSKRPECSGWDTCVRLSPFHFFLFSSNTPPTVQSGLFFGGSALNNVQKSDVYQEGLCYIKETNQLAVREANVINIYDVISQ